MMATQCFARWVNATTDSIQRAELYGRTYRQRLVGAAISYDNRKAESFMKTMQMRGVYINDRVDAIVSGCSGNGQPL